MPRGYDVEMAKEAYEKFKPWAIHVDPSFASAELSEYFHERGVYVWINALGKVDEAIGKGDIQPFLKLLETNPSIIDRKSTRLNSSHVAISYAVFCLKK